MDPVLTKKIDYETTHGLDDWDQTLDDLASEYAKQQWGSESLSHHFLPLLRYRRAKARKAAARWARWMGDTSVTVCVQAEMLCRRRSGGAH